jgi:methylated-DNA-protein-cysteine methyltransferase-like protein
MSFMTARQKKKEPKPLSPFEHVYEIVRKIPRGKVYTYGAISKRMNKRLSAAAVGWAMNGLGNGKNEEGYNSNNVPWHRVINSKGKLSTQIESSTLAADGRPDNLQRILLEQEGVSFRDDESVDLNLYLWNGE